MRVVAMIPARFNASRLPGKLMMDLGGFPVIQRTYQAVLNSKLFDDVYVVTDSIKIYKLIKKIGGSVFISKKKHLCGTDRIAEFAIETKSEIVVNVQGDEPYIDYKSLKKLINVFIDDKEKKIDLASLMQSIKIKDFKNPNKVKVLVDKNNFAINFSRLVKDNTNTGNNKFSVFKHIGVYAFRINSLMGFYNSVPTAREKAEKLEQLRYIEKRKNIKMVYTKHNALSIDVMEDLINARKIIDA
ncbi:MAG: 3-deoxy-manno-octulosonate cytidylyltransferase [Flavobacteriaceae bacterium]